MSKHTPGPWDAWIRKSKFGITGPAAADCMNAINAVKDEPYCVGGSAIQIASESREAPAIAFGNNKETAEANAHLIAAAPDMLDMLQRLYKAGGIWPDLLPGLQAVIAKATGNRR